MSKLVGRRIIAAVAIVFSVMVVGLALTASEIGVTSAIGYGGRPLSASDLSAVPQAVVEDADRLATQLCGDYQKKYDDLVNQLLATYLEAQDRDFVILFNSGGWGWEPVEMSPGWRSIFTGLNSELNSWGYRSLLLNYQRTVDSLRGRLNELTEMITGYSSKAEELAGRVEFLTSHFPKLRVIIAGESLGTVISDRTMSILTDNQQVYSIQTGTPFWHQNIMLERTLVINNNGIIPDAFSRGDFWTIVRVNLKALFGLSQPENKTGTVLRFFGAPGHDYWWQDPGVCSQIQDFLKEKVGIEW